MSYAVNDDQLTVYEIETGTTVCTCGPLPTSATGHEGAVVIRADGLAWGDEQTQRTFAVLIARLLNEGAP